MSSFVSYFRFLQNSSVSVEEWNQKSPSRNTRYLSPFPFLLAPSRIEADGHTLHPTGGLSSAPPGLSHSDLRPWNLRLCCPGPGRPAAADVLYPGPWAGAIPAHHPSASPPPSLHHHLLLPLPTTSKEASEFLPRSQRPSSLLPPQYRQSCDKANLVTSLPSLKPSDS